MPVATNFVRVFVVGRGEFLLRDDLCVPYWMLAPLADIVDMALDTVLLHPGQCPVEIGVAHERHGDGPAFEVRDMTFRRRNEDAPTVLPHSNVRMRV